MRRRTTVIIGPNSAVSVDEFAADRVVLRLERGSFHLDSANPGNVYVVMPSGTVTVRAATVAGRILPDCTEVALLSVGRAEVVVRLKADCAFIDPGLIDAVARKARETGASYVSNYLEPSYPLGMEVEAASAHALGRAASGMDAEAAVESSPMRWLRTRPAPFPQVNIRAARDWSGLDWRVRTPADLDFARSVYDALHAADPAFGMDAVLTILQSRQDLAVWAA